jgi:hypothetical protein
LRRKIPSPPGPGALLGRIDCVAKFLRHFASPTRGFRCATKWSAKNPRRCAGRFAPQIPAFAVPPATDARRQRDGVASPIGDARAPGCHVSDHRARFTGLDRSRLRCAAKTTRKNPRRAMGGFAPQRKERAGPPRPFRSLRRNEDAANPGVGIRHVRGKLSAAAQRRTGLLHPWSFATLHAARRPGPGEFGPFRYGSGSSRHVPPRAWH